MNDTQVLPDVEELVTLEPPAMCEHSMHNMLGWQHQHHGPATHWVRAIHDCETGHPVVYPACQKFTAHVLAMTGLDWMCPVCKHIDLGRHMIEVIGPING